MKVSMALLIGRVDGYAKPIWRFGILWFRGSSRRVPFFMSSFTKSLMTQAMPSPARAKSMDKPDAVAGKEAVRMLAGYVVPVQHNEGGFPENRVFFRGTVFRHSVRACGQERGEVSIGGHENVRNAF